MSDKPVDAQKGRFWSILDAIKGLAAESPLLAGIFVAIILPLIGMIVTNAATFNWGPVIPLIGILSAVIIFVCIPLIVTNTWKKVTEQTAEMREKAVMAEAERRRIREENEQLRFNTLVDAKIRNIEAQTSFVLSQSDRHQMELLKKTSEELAEFYKKGQSFISQEVFTKNISQILEELQSVHLDYDTVLESVRAIEAAMQIEKKEVQIQVVDQMPVDPTEKDITNWEGIADVRQRIIEDQLKEIDDLNSALIKHTGQPGEIEQQPTEMKISVQTKPSELTPLTDEQVEQSRINQEMKEALRVVEGLSEKEEPPNLNDMLDGESDTEPTHDPITQAIIDKANENGIAAPKALEVWSCFKCETQNSLNVTKCSKCGLGKAASEELAKA